jgi:outer membrane protein OmpA-like peptidoglycan-associated protein
VTRARVVLSGAALGALLLCAPAASADDTAPVPEGYQAPASTVNVKTAWEAPLSTVAKFYTKPAQATKEQLSEALGAKDKTAGTLVTLSDRFLFDFGSADLAPTAAASLDTLIALMKGTTGPVTVTGHTDSVGTDAVNQPLSEKRAEAVKAYLVSKGIAAARITTAGKGSSEPIADNEVDGRDNPEGRQQNRRVEVLFAKG